MTDAPTPVRPGGSPLSHFDRAAGRRRPSIVFHRLDQLPPRPARAEVIAGLAAGGEIVALVGAPGGGKSALAVLVSNAIANGSTFLSRPVLQGAILYVAAERAGEVERRLKAAASPAAPIYVSDARPQLADAQSVDELIGAIGVIADGEPSPIHLIVLDTAARCFRGLDENASRDIGLAVEGMSRIVEAHPTAVLLILHHTDKAGNGMRGSGALLGAVDLELTVRGTGSARRIEVTKANAVEEGQRLGFHLVARRSPDGSDVIEAKAADGEAGGPKAAPRLPPDARTALDAIGGLAVNGVVSLDAAREAAMQRFGDRKPPAKRKAWSKALQNLTDSGRIIVNDNRVSVSNA